MSVPSNFRSLALSIAQEKGYAALLPVLEKELLHYEILAAMDKSRLLDGLVFQGGTSLRLCYGSERFSEDLDFAGGANFDGSSMSSIKEVLEKAIAQRYDVVVIVIEPKLRKLEQKVQAQLSPQDDEQQLLHGFEKESVSVDCWQIQVITQKERPDIPKQKIKLEIAAIPAHTRTVRALISNYEALPYGYSNILIPVEEPEEIAADKLLALSVSSYTRYRDIWDLRWLAVRPRFKKERLGSLVRRKIEDYHVTNDYQQIVEEFLPTLPDLINDGAFLGLMRRFLPAETIQQTLERESFRQHIIDTLIELYMCCLESM